MKLRRKQHERLDAQPIDAMPAELVHEVVAYLRPHDLTNLARVSKRYSDFAQSVLWRDVELHRQDGHDNYFAMSTFRSRSRAWLDDQLRDPWSYRGKDGVDVEFERRNAKFGTAIRNLYRTAGQSRGWMKIAPYVRHLCITITNKSPPCVWNMILSLPNLISLEVIGELDRLGKGPPSLPILREAKAETISTVRLRGYIPAPFVAAVCSSSLHTISSLDVGLLEAPLRNPSKVDTFFMNENEMHFAPRGLLWFPVDGVPMFKFLTHLTLCKPGRTHEGPDDILGLIPDIEEHIVQEFENWVALLHAVRETLVELVLEQRPVYSSSWIMGEDMPVSGMTNFDHYIPPFDPNDDLFVHHLLIVAFTDGLTWPKLSRLILRGIKLAKVEQSIEETLQAFTTRTLPGVDIRNISGEHMFFDAGTGAAVGWQNADGLLPHLDPHDNPYGYDFEHWDDLNFYTI